MKFLSIVFTLLLSLTTSYMLAQNVQTNSPLVTCGKIDLLWNNIIDKPYGSGVAEKVGSPRSLFSQKKAAPLQFDSIGQIIERNWVLDQPIQEREFSDFAFKVRFELNQYEENNRCVRIGYNVESIDGKTNSSTHAIGYTEYFGDGCIPAAIEKNSLTAKIDRTSNKYLLKHTYAERSGIFSKQMVKLAVLGIGLECKLEGEEPVL